MFCGAVVFLLLFFYISHTFSKSFYFLLGLGRSGTHQLTNNNSLIRILEDIQLTHELLKGRDGRDGVTGRDGLPGPPGTPG